MSNAPNQQPQPTPVLPNGLPDDWRLDRDLHCPQCRYNLRTLHTPRCPECGLVFRWPAILHIGCPRCGESLRETNAAACPNCDLALNWERLLSDADPALFRQFEYSLDPIRAGLRTWFEVLRPIRFWKELPIEAPPVVSRLNRLAATSALTCLGGFLLFFLANRLLGMSLAEMLDPLIIGLATAFTFPVVGALSWLIFDRTLATFRVRREQLLRCTTYGFCGMALIGLFIALMTLTIPLINLASGAKPNLQSMLFFDLQLLSRVMLGDRRLAMLLLAATITTVVVVIPIAGIAFIWWPRFLYVAMRRYLKLDSGHTRALLLSILTIGWLTWLSVVLGCVAAAQRFAAGLYMGWYQLTS